MKGLPNAVRMLGVVKAPAEHTAAYFVAYFVANIRQTEWVVT
jgi:hypothetical protein